MRIKTSIAIGLTIILISVVSILTIPALKVESNQNFVQTQIPVVFKPLRVGNEIVPVEIQCQPVIITRPDTLETFSCILINRTNKSIRASSVKYSVIFDSNGKEEQESHWDTVDTFIHPDLLGEKKQVEPGGRLFVIPPGPIVEPNSVIKRLELEPSYIEFIDGTTVGMGGKSAEMITNLREGAAKYKNALRREYFNRGKSAQAILPLLEDNAPLGSEILNFEQQTGAKAYRRFLSKKYEKNGIAVIDGILNK